MGASLIAAALVAKEGDTSAVQGQLTGGVQALCSTGEAFAALKDDGSVATWGDADEGGDSSSVQGQLAKASLVQRPIYRGRVPSFLAGQGSYPHVGDPTTSFKKPEKDKIPLKSLKQKDRIAFKSL